MTQSLLIIIFFASCYAIKGGQLRYVFNNIKHVREKSWFYDRLLDGKILSTILVLLFGAVAYADYLGDMEYSVNWQPAIMLAIGWILSIAPSMGEEYGAIKNDKNSPYMMYPDFGRGYGIKKAIQRGIYAGAVMAVFTGYLPFIIFSLAFVPLAWIAFKIGDIFKFDGWALSEILIGAVCYGLPMIGVLMI